MAGKKIAERTVGLNLDISSFIKDAKKAEDVIDKLTEKGKVKLSTQLNLGDTQALLDKIVKQKTVDIRVASNVGELLGNMQSAITQFSSSGNKSLAELNSKFLNDFKTGLKDVSFKLDDGSLVKGYEQAIPLAQQLVGENIQIQQTLDSTAGAAQKASKVIVDGIENQTKALKDMGNQAVLTAKQLEAATTRYNKWMNRAGYSHRTVGLGQDDGYTQGWNLRDMVSEAQATIANMRDIGMDSGTLSQMKSELNGLQGFIDKYVPFIEGLRTTMNHESKFDNTSLERLTQLAQLEEKHAAATKERAQAEIDSFYEFMANSTKKQKAIESTTKTAQESTNVIVDGSKKQIAAQTEVTEAIKITEKQMEQAKKKYNELMRMAGRDHEQIGAFGGGNDTSKYNLRDMVSEVQSTLDTYYENGHRNHDFRYESADAYKAWKSEKDKLERFIKHWEPYIGNLQTTGYHGSKFDNTPQLEGQKQKATEATTKSLERQGQAYNYIARAGLKDHSLIENEKIKRLSIEATNKALEQQAVNLDQLNKKKQEVQGKIDQSQRIMSIQEDWFRYLNRALDDSRFTTSGKKEATDQLRYYTQALVQKRMKNYEGLSGQYPKEMAEVFWMKAYLEAQRQKVADSTLTRYKTDADWSYEQNLKVLQDEYAEHQKIFQREQEELNVLKQQSIEIDKQIQKAQELASTMTATAKSVETATEATRKEVQESEKLRQVRQEIAALYIQSRQKRDELKAVSGLGGFDSNQISEMAKTNNEIAKLYGEYQALNQQRAAKISYRDSLRQGLDSKDTIRDLENVQRLISSLVNKYGNASFNNIFGKTISDFGVLNASNALQLYDALIERNRQYIAEKQKEEEQNKRIAQEVQTLETYYNQNAKALEKVAGSTESYNNILQQVKSGAMSAADGVGQLNAQLEQNAKLMSNKYNIQKGPALAKYSFGASTTDPSTLLATDAEIKAALSGIKGEVNNLIKGYYFGDDNQQVAKDMMMSALTSMVHAVKLSEMGHQNESDKFWTEATTKLGQINDYFLKNATSRQGNTINYEQFAQLLDYLKKSPIKYTDEYKGDFTSDEWKAVLSKFTKGSQPILTSDPSARTVDQMYSEIVNSFPELFKDLKINEKDRLRQVLLVASQARAALQNVRKTMDVPVRQEEANYITNTLIDFANGIQKNVENILKAPEGAEKILQQSTEKALAALRSATNNKNAVVDLSQVFSTDNLHQELQNMFANIGKQANFSVKGIDIAGDTATVQLYNKELELTVTQVYRLRDAVDEANGKTLQLDDSRVSQNTKALADGIAKMQNEMRNASTVVDTLESKLSKLGDVKGVANATNSIKSMRAEIENFNKALTTGDKQTAYNNFKNAQLDYNAAFKQAQEAQKSAEQKLINDAWKNQFQNNYKYNNGKTAQDQTHFDSMKDYYTKQEQEAQTHNNNMKVIYNDLMNTMRQLNTVNSKINQLTLQDGGTGYYAQAINNLEQQRTTLMSSFGDIQSQIQNVVNIPQGANGLTAFFDAARERAVLTEAEIQKLQMLMTQLNNTGFNFTSKITSMVQPTMEKLDSLKQMVASGAIDGDFAKNIASAYSTMSASVEQFNKQSDTASAMNLLGIQKQVGPAVDAWHKLATAEQQYFQNKTKYKTDTTMSSLAAQTTKDTDAAAKAQQRLTEAAQQFAKDSGANGAIITKFTESANGISKLDFSVLDRGTNSVRKFSMEMGKASQQIYATETTINQSMKNMQTGEQQLSRMTDVLNRLKTSGVDTKSNAADGSIVRMTSLVNDLQVALQKKDDNAISNLIRQSKLAVSEVEKLEAKMQKTLGLIADKKATSIGTIARHDANIQREITLAVEQYAAGQYNTALSVGKFDAAQQQLNFTLTRGNGQVQKCTASYDAYSKQIVTQTKGVEKLKTGWQAFSDIMAHSVRQAAYALVGYNVFYTVIAQVRKGIGYVKEIDLAMTELKKVTDETAQSYKRFQEVAADSAGKVGATISDYINATADFAKLGYTVNEAAQMADAAIVYKNVADGLDTIEASTESITSTMKAFGIESDGTMGIIDRFNEVGKLIAQIA